MSLVVFAVLAFLVCGVVGLSEATSFGAVINSLIIFMLFTCIYAVLATNLYGDDYQDLFGSLSSSIFTMLQIATGDGWYSLVAREIKDPRTGLTDKYASLFFTSYMLVVGVVLLNIVIAGGKFRLD